MKVRMIVVVSLVALAGLFAVPTAQAQVTVGIGIRVGPPALRHERVIARPSAHSVWIRGYWAWRPRLNRYVWIRGRWVAERPGFVWVDGSWAHGERGWVWKEGYWHRGEVRVHERNAVREGPARHDGEHR